MAKPTTKPPPPSIELVHSAERTGWRVWYGDLVLPLAFWAHFDDEDADYTASIRVHVTTRRPRIVAVVAELRDLRNEFTSVMLRGLVLKRLLVRALDAAAQPNNGRSVTKIDDIPPGASAYVAGRVTTRKRGTAARRSPKFHRRDGDELTDAIRAFADAYTEAKGRGITVKPHACAAAGISEGSYGRYLELARERGYIERGPSSVRPTN